MTWEQRGEKRYYYRNEWTAGRSVRTYLGAGAIAEMAANADALRHVELEMATRQQWKEEELCVVAELPLLELCVQTDLLVRAALMAAGYHQHDRGEWRRKRERRTAEREA